MSSDSNQKDLGLLILRVGIGVMFILHALPKLLGGPTAWEGLAQFGLPFLPAGFISIAFGFSAMAVELVGGLLLALGKFHRISCASLAGVMLVATTTKLGNVTSITDFAKEAGWPLELMIVFIALFFTGPGKIALGKSSPFHSADCTPLPLSPLDWTQLAGLQADLVELIRAADIHHLRDPLERNVLVRNQQNGRIRRQFTR